ncbi:MAG: PucR family transcriptional regulator, partial [Solirubrobacterales bacterium]|nr:PucR family transcriptional regulator [Solirubrobacterales bacterium]
MNDKRRPWEDLPTAAIDAWAPHLPALADEIIDAIRQEVPAYARPLEGAFGQAVRIGVEEALSRFDPRAGPGGGRNVYVALGRGEAREGRTLDALLAAYRVGAQIAWRRLAEAGLQAGLEPETLVLLAESIFASIDELSAASAEGFAREQAAREGEAGRRRAALVELLVRDPPPAEAALAAAADDARWPLPRTLAIVVWAAEHGERPARRL